MTSLDKHLHIKNSELPGAGMGLFTRVAILKGAFITEYKGKITTWKEVDHDKGRNAYLYYVSRLHVINAKPCREVLARYANDAKGPRRISGVKNNCCYSITGKKVFIKAIKYIPAGSEVLVGYGKAYWDILMKNKGQ